MLASCFCGIREQWKPATRLVSTASLMYPCSLPLGAEQHATLMQAHDVEFEKDQAEPSHEAFWGLSFATDSLGKWHIPFGAALALSHLLVRGSKRLMIRTYNSSMSARLKSILLSDVKAASTSNTNIISATHYRTKRSHHLSGMAGSHARAWSGSAQSF